MTAEHERLLQLYSGSTSFMQPSILNQLSFAGVDPVHVLALKEEGTPTVRGPEGDVSLQDEKATAQSEVDTEIVAAVVRGLVQRVANGVDQANASGPPRPEITLANAQEHADVVRNTVQELDVARSRANQKKSFRKKASTAEYGLSMKKLRAASIRVHGLLDEASSSDDEDVKAYKAATAMAEANAAFQALGCADASIIGGALASTHVGRGRSGFVSLEAQDNVADLMR
jgi:hypothetical protein